MTRTLRRIATIFFDIPAAALAAIIGVIALALAAATTRRKRRRDRVLTIATAEIFRAAGDDVEAFNTYYVYPGAQRSIAAFFDAQSGRGFVGRSLPKLMGLCLQGGLQPALKSVLPLTASVVAEGAAAVRAVRVADRARAGTIAVLAPSRVAPRALLVALSLRARLVVKVAGNIALFNHMRRMSKRSRLRSCLAWAQATASAAFYQCLYRYASLVIGYNANNAASAIALGAHPAKTRMLRIRPYASTLTATPAERPTDARIVLWSRLSAGKAVHEGVAAGLAALEARPEASFLIVGEGPERAALEGLVAASSARDRVRFAGWMAREDLFTEIRGAAAAVLPLSGYALLEAAMLGVPVVCFDFEWHSELILHCESGLLADYPDVAHMASLIVKLLDDPAQGVAYAAAARRRVEVMFNPQRRDEDEARVMSVLFA